MYMKKTNTFLDKIIANKARELKVLKQSRSLKSLQNSLSERKTKLRNFSKAISNKNRLSLIAEIKKASPSAGLIRSNFDHKFIAKEYEKSGLVDAISVLTEKKYFQGDIKFIKDIKKVASVPILRKDFIFDEYQVYESYLGEADALLLIVSILTKNKLRNFINLTHKLSMQCLVEVHDEKEVNIAIDAGAKIIGVNARDLKTFKINKDLFKELANLIPASIIKISESGLEDKKDLQLAHQHGASAVLVGASIIKANDIGLKLKELRI